MCGCYAHITQTIVSLCAGRVTPVSVGSCCHGLEFLIFYVYFHALKVKRGDNMFLWCSIIQINTVENFVKCPIF